MLQFYPWYCHAIRGDHFVLFGGGPTLTAIAISPDMPIGQLVDYLPSTGERSVHVRIEMAKVHDWGNWAHKLTDCNPWAYVAGIGALRGRNYWLHDRSCRRR